MADFDINSLLSSISQEDMENLKKTAARILSDASPQPEKADTPQKSAEPLPGALTDILGGLGNLGALGNLGGLGMPDLSQLSSVLPVLNALNNKDDRLDFINALKPLVSEGKRKKADEAMRLIRLFSVIPILREGGIL